MFRVTSLLLTIVFSTALASFAKDFQMQNRSSTVPGAQGTIHTDKDSSGNISLEVKVRHLAPPQKLTPVHQHYVVWVQQRGEPPTQLGVLEVKGDSQAGSLKGTTPSKVFDVFITAEDQRTPPAPTGPEILRGQVDET